VQGMPAAQVQAPVLPAHTQSEVVQWLPPEVMHSAPEQWQPTPLQWGYGLILPVGELWGELLLG